MANCDPCFINTQIVIKPQSCIAKFIFTPDLYMTPQSNEICPINVEIFKNCKEDYKIILLDDDGCSLNEIIINCSQYNILDIQENFIDLSYSILNLYEFTDSSFNQILQINANNLQLVNEYVNFEKSAYQYRCVESSYINLWANDCYFNCEILDDTNQMEAYINNFNNTKDSISALQIYSLTNDFIKLRTFVIKKLCKCGNLLINEYLPNTNNCQKLNGCCN